MSLSKTSPTNVHFVVASITAASVLGAPVAAHAGAGADARAAVQRALVAQGAIAGTVSGAPLQANGSLGGAGSTAGLLLTQAQAQLARDQARRQTLLDLQASARAAAQAAASSVPNGLAAGGLVPASGATAGSTLWSGAALPAQQITNGAFTVTIEQNEPQANLTWDSFNIGRETKLVFSQAQSDWVVFNQIVDPSGAPSRILGSIEAAGQVYVINPNGVIFGGSSQVNTRTLVASALPINDGLVARGLLNNPDTQFLFSGITVPAGAQTNAFVPPAPTNADGRYGDVIVEAGAILSSPTNADKSGGRVALVGANVVNAGSISTPDGQTVLAAGLQVGLEASTDASLRGLIPSVGQVGDYAGSATNTGVIEAARGAITVVGKEVSQNGSARATTSVSRNGRVDLLAQYGAVGVGDYASLPDFFSTQTGLVTFGAASVTQVLPEVASAEKTVGATLALGSQVNARGLVVHLAEDASLLAPSATVSLDAGDWNLLQLGTGEAKAQFVHSAGQVYLDAGASVDVAGSAGVQASVTDNIVTANLRGDELADSPLQRDGALRGQTIQVDMLQTGVYDGRAWVGTPLADVSGYINLVQRGIGQLTASGGTVNINAGDSVVLAEGSSIDVSGGYVDYQSGVVQTTKVLYQGNILDIAKATPDLVYEGIYDGVSTPLTNTEKWGASAASGQASLNRLFLQTTVAGYIQGGDAGSLSISAPAVALDGDLSGSSVSGPRQTTSPARSGSLTLAFQGQYADPLSPTGYFTDSRSAPVVRFETDATQVAPSAFGLDSSGRPLALPTARVATVGLSPDLVASGFGRITVDNREGDIVVAPGGGLALPAGGELSLSGAKVLVQDDLSAPSGKISLAATAVSQGAINQSTVNGAAPVGEAGRGLVEVASSVRISAAGVVENTAVGADTDPALVKGGSVSITGFDVDLEAGSVVDVSGGVFASPGARYSYGDGGSISLFSGQDSNIKNVIGGTLSLEAELLGYSGARGASLTVQAPLVQVGDAASAATGATVFSEDFFQRGGFSAYDIRGLGEAVDRVSDTFTPAVRIAAGVEIRPVVDSYLVRADETAPEKLSFDIVRLDASQRNATSVSFTAQGVRDPYNSGNPLLVRGDLVVGAGAMIVTDPGAKISLAGDTVFVDGSLVAHGGSISIRGAANSNVVFPNSADNRPVATVRLGSEAVLDTSGVLVSQPDTSGRSLRLGRVLAGGNISLAGNIQTDAGSVIDVSGATSVLDLAPAYSGASSGGALSLGTVPTRVDSSGGSLTLAGGQQLVVASTLRGEAGGDSAEGGKLLVSSGIYVPVNGVATTQRDVNLVVTQTLADSPDLTRGNFAADSFNSGGFDSLTLGGTVRFEGDVSLSATRDLRVGSSGVIYADGDVSLSAARVSLGTALQNPRLAGQDPDRAFYDANNNPLALAPVYGAATLSVSATQLVDVGNLSLQGVGAATLNAASGDIRGSGTFDIAGDLTLRAGQVYPPTAAVFSINAYDYSVAGVAHAGSITVESDGSRPGLPISAGGTLNLRATEIVQNGVLRAPFGAINLGWNGVGSAPVDAITGAAVPTSANVTLGAGSVTSVSGVDSRTGKAVTVPYGAYVNGTAWVDPQGNDITNFGPPEKEVVLSAGTVTTAASALVELDGGGELVASRFKTGVGGKIDILAASGAFAIIPGYDAGFAPFGAFNDSVNGQKLLGGDLGYVSSGLALGDRVYLDASPGLPAGYYTLLPARYAVVPGAFLVTPKSAAPLASAAVQADHAVYVSGYRFNSDGSEPSAAPLRSLFEVASVEVVQKRATYETPTATVFFRENAADRGVSAPRLAGDAGRLVFTATQAMDLAGGVSARASEGGLGGEVDIDSPGVIRIGGPDGSAASGELFLDAASLDASRLGGASLLIGGRRSGSDEGTVIAVNADRIIVDNAGAALTGAEIVLAASESVTLAAGAEIRQTGALGGASSSLVIGDSAVAGSGDGALLRVGASSDAKISREGVSANSTASLSIGAGSVVSGGASLAFDSTGATSIDASSDFGAGSLSLSSGRISLRLDDAGALPSDAGLVLGGEALDRLQSSSKALSLLSYSSVDLYGVGTVGSASFDRLVIGAPAIRGFNQNGGAVAFAARSIELNGGIGGSAPLSSSVGTGSLSFSAETLTVGSGLLSVAQFSGLTLGASKRLVFSGEGGLSASGDVTVDTPLVTADTAASQALSAGGALHIAGAAAATSVSSASGLGASLTLSGGQGVSIDSALELASGRISVIAASGAIAIGENAAARLDVGGVSREIQDVEVYTNAGSLALSAVSGDVRLGGNGVLDVSAEDGGGKAGTISVSAASGRLSLAGSVLGSASDAGEGGSFSADLGSLADGSLRSFDTMLNQGGFDASRAYRVRSGDVTVAGLARAASYLASADNGSLTVSGRIDASGRTGGQVDLSAHHNLVLLSGSAIDASAETFDSAGKGGSVRLVAGASRDGLADPGASLTLAEGSRIDLSVGASNPEKDAALGHATGTLHLRAPRTAAGDDLRVDALSGEIVGASSVVLEGFKVHDLTPASGTSATLGTAARTAALADASLFGNAAAAILSRVALDIDSSILHVQPGVEIVNRAGDLVLQGIWDLSTARYGSAASYADREPGVLTLRAAGDILLPYAASGSASLSDGFGTGVVSSANTTTLWNAALLPQGSRSWTIELAAGADLAAARSLAVLAADASAPSKGSIIVGDGAPEFSAALDTRQAAAGVPRYYQVIRTGTGDISLAARGDIELRNNLATIYTAGTQAAAIAGFDTPDTGYNTAATDLGARQYTGAAYPAQYALLGGDVSLSAQNDIFRTFAGHADSSKQMPENWLYRRGALDSDTGEFSAYNNATANGPRTQRNSTTWWVDYNNFFEGVGALGGGNVSVVAGSDVANIDAVAPTNARMPYGKPDASKLVELGGGDVVVRAGGDIDGGVYYVARGRGSLVAGGDITTNATRTTVAGADAAAAALTAPTTWLPTTLFLSDGSFDLSAGGDLTLGAVADPFLLPGGINNSYFLKSYFGTVSADASVSVASLTGDIDLRSRNSGASAGSLLDWFDNVLRRNPALPTATLAGRNQPWLRLYEKDVSAFATASTLLPGDVSATAFTGDLGLAGEFNFRPSSQGGLSLIAAGSVNGLQVVNRDAEAGVDQWATAVLDFSDADPARLPGVESPLSVSVKGLANSVVVNRVVGTTVDMSGVNALFAESGSYTGDVYGRLQTKQALHAADSVHAESNEPVRILAGSGDISGLTLYSGKFAEVSAGRDISDVALYLQNLRAGDVSVVSAGRDILLYNPGSELRVRAQTGDNALLGNALFPGPGDGSPTAGDLQIGGPGSLQVAAGRDLDLGAALSSGSGAGLRSPGDGTAVGLSSIGNARNLSLPAEGARVVIGVGLGDSSKIDRAALERVFLDPASAGDRAARYLSALAARLGLSDSADAATLWSAYVALPEARRAELALVAFARILRDAGRDHNDDTAAGFGTYRDGFEAIATLFPGDAWDGDLRLSSRELRTAGGGDILVYAPGGSIDLGADVAKTQTPPGIITERGGSISLFTKDDVDIGTQRIFTLRGGDILIWSSAGDIAAGSSSTTLQSASPTRVLVDPQNGDVKTDLAGLATGGGIGVLAAIEGVRPGDVDLIAPVGTIDAGDAGIRSAGNLNISALKVINAANISAGGATTGAPAVSAPAIGGLASSPATNAAAGAATEQAAATAASPAKALALPSLVTIEVMGYGGSADAGEEEKPGEKPEGA